MRTPRSSEFIGPSRREVILLGIGAFAVATAPFLIGRRRHLVRRSVPVMGTIADIGVVHRDQEYAQAAVDAAIRQLRYVDRTMSVYSESSDVGRANLTATGDATAITSATATVVAESLRWAEASDGAFDPCIGQAVNLWDVKNRSTPVVRLSDAAAAIDLGGIAKGYAVDLAVRSLREWGIEHGLVNAGGDLYAMGESEDGDPWSVGVRSPQDPTEISYRFELANAAVATSGDYLQNFRYGGTLYHHLLDPVTAAPRRTTVHSVTVTADNCMAADAAATAVFGMEHEKAERMLKSAAPRARVVTSL
jgi:thiamine biosynthesis lipoprotein